MRAAAAGPQGEAAGQPGEEQSARVGQIAEEILTAYLLMILKLFICLI